MFPFALGAVRSPSNIQRGLKTVLERAGAPGCPPARSPTIGHAKPSMTQEVHTGRVVAPAEAARALGAAT